jgi:hypothetical protein
MTEVPHVKISVASTISVFNVWSITDFHRYFVENTQYYDGVKFDLSILHYPQEYSIQILPAAMKQKISAKIDAHISFLEKKRNLKKKKAVIICFRNIQSHLFAKDESYLLPEFVRRTKELDAIRGENFVSVFPEYAEWYQSL